MTPQETLCDRGRATGISRWGDISVGSLRMRYPKREFPAWVLEHERDLLLWISGTDGMSLVVRISGAVGLFMVVVILTLGRARLQRAMSAS